jgi:hypothetical protein
MARCRCRIMLVMVMSSPAGNGGAKMTSPLRDVDVESC